MGDPDWLKLLDDFLMGIGDRSEELYLEPKKGTGEDIPRVLAPK
jgi:hypothetical protein